MALRRLACARQPPPQWRASLRLWSIPAPHTTHALRMLGLLHARVPVDEREQAGAAPPAVPVRMRGRVVAGRGWRHGKEARRLAVTSGLYRAMRRQGRLLGTR